MPPVIDEGTANPWLAGATDHMVQLPGLHMHYVSAGPDDGYPVILLHGFPEFWYSWRHQIPVLAREGYRVIAPDQRGYNLTDKQGPYDIPTLREDIVHLQDALGIEESHVVGHDWGAVAAWAFAAEHPDRVGKLVTMNGPHPNAYLDACRSHPRQLLRSWYIYFFQIPFLPEWVIGRDKFGVIRNLMSRISRKHMSADDVERYVEACARPGAMSAMIGWYRALPWQIISNRGALPQPKINVPTMVVWGERDVALDKGCNDTLNRYVPDLRLHFIKEANHWVQIHRPYEVNMLLLEFFRA